MKRGEVDKNELASLILDSSNHGVFLLDKNKRIVECNKTATELLSYKKNEILGKEFVFYKDIKQKKEFEKLLKKKKEFSIDSEIKKKDGSVLQVKLYT
ncbi:PAS domain-containing protein, partial [Candidatus Woesearchaeota archaeon]